MNDLKLAHLQSSGHRNEVCNSEKCGCFSCLTIFHPSEIEEWIEGETALCPYCSVDAIIGENNAYDITPEFLRRMKRHWFGVCDS